MALDNVITLQHILRDLVGFILTLDVEHKVRDPCADGVACHGGVYVPVQVVLHGPSLR